MDIRWGKVLQAHFSFSKRVFRFTVEKSIYIYTSDLTRKQIRPCLFFQQTSQHPQTKVIEERLCKLINLSTILILSSYRHRMSVAFFSSIFQLRFVTPLRIYRTSHNTSPFHFDQRSAKKRKSIKSKVVKPYHCIPRHIRFEKRFVSIVKKTGFNCSQFRVQPLWMYLYTDQFINYYTKASSTLEQKKFEVHSSTNGVMDVYNHPARIPQESEELGGCSHRFLPEHLSW